MLDIRDSLGIWWGIATKDGTKALLGVALSSILLLTLDFCKGICYYETVVYREGEQEWI